MVAQVVENQNVKSIRKKVDPIVSQRLVQLIGEENLDTLVKFTNVSILDEKQKDFLEKVSNEIYKANRRPKVQRKYYISSNSDADNFIRRVETMVDGYINPNAPLVREKYNPETDTWEEYQEKVLSLEEIKEQLGNIQHKTVCTAYDIQTYGKMLDRLPDSNEEELLNSDGLMCIGRALQDKAAQLLLDVDQLDLLDSDLRAIIKDREIN